MKNIILSSSLTALGFMSVITYCFVSGHICLNQAQAYPQDYVQEITEFKKARR